MHSKIFQLATTPIKEEDFLKPEHLYGDCDFADYVGDEMTGDLRRDFIESLARQLSDIVDLDGETLVFKGIGNFVHKWYEYIKEKANALDDSKVDTSQLYWVEKATERTHLDTSYRIYLEEWNNYAGPMCDFINFADSVLKPGDRLYVGSVIDYHY